MKAKIRNTQIEKPSILGQVWHFLGTYQGIIWLCLSGLTITALLGINWVALKMDSTSLVLMGLTALLLGGFIFQRHIKQWLALCGMGCLGLWYLLLGWAALGSPVWQICKAFAQVIKAWFTHFINNSTDDIPNRADDLLQTIQLLQEKLLQAHQDIITLLNRFDYWFNTLGEGAVPDPLITQLIWGGAIWLSITLLGWGVWHHQKAIIASLPLGTLLSVAVFFSSQSYGYIAFFLLFLLLLQSSLQSFKRYKGWLYHKLDYADNLFFDLNIIVMPLVCFIIIVAFLVPQISISKITNSFYKWLDLDADQINEVAQSFGVQNAPPPVVVSSLKGLPRTHLLGNNPKLNEQVVMIIRTGELDPLPPQMAELIDIPTHYWQGATYDRYITLGWTFSEVETESLAANTSITKPQGPSKQVQQTIQRGSHGGQFLYTSGSPLMVNKTIEAQYRTADDLVVATIADEVYQADSWLPDTTPALLRQAGVNYPQAIKQKYLNLPRDFPDRVRNLALKLTITEPTPYDKALAIERYLRTFPYNLDVPQPPTGKDVTEYFLFELQQGYCDYYASSMVVLARAAGLPARFVMGYSTGNYNISQAYYVVTEANAHSWAQVYFPNVGWVNFEPTAGLPPITREAIQEANVNLPPLPDLDIIEDSTAKTENERWLIHPFWWALLLVIFGYFIINLERWQLNRLPPKVLSQQLYQRLVHTAERTGFRAIPGYTPYEFAAQFNKYLEQHLLNTPLYHWQPNRFEGIKKLAELLVEYHYVPEKAQGVPTEPIYRTWFALRRQLWQVIIIVRIFKNRNSKNNT